MHHIMNELYPLKFNPLFREKVWGGDKIRSVLGMDYGALPNCGEAWVLSGVPGNQTTVRNGFLKGNELNELVEVYMDDLVGEKVFGLYGQTFPLLVKFIDANDYLSIQVHPDDELARKRQLGNGKTEMWYILDAQPGSELISGFNRPMDREAYLRHFEAGDLRSVLNVEKVAKGECYFMPAGRIHALGPGILLAEIQQSSDTTYRIYDWDRVDGSGNPRELHVEEALEAIRFSGDQVSKCNTKPVMNRSATLVTCPQFTTSVLDCDKPIELDYSYFGSFILYTCVAGNMTVTDGKGRYSLKTGETMLIPAACEKILLIPEPFCRILSTYID